MCISTVRSSWSTPFIKWPRYIPPVPQNYWRQQCSEMYDVSNDLQKHIQTVEVGCKQKSGVVGRHKCFWGVWRLKCFSSVWRHQCSKMYDGSNALKKYISVFFQSLFSQSVVLRSLPDLPVFACLCFASLLS